MIQYNEALCWVDRMSAREASSKIMQAIINVTKLQCCNTQLRNIIKIHDSARRDPE